MTHPGHTQSGATVTARIGGIAGLAFIIIGIIELALTSGSIPSPTEAGGALFDYLAGAESVGRPVAVLSGVAGLSLLVYTVGLGHLIARSDPTLGSLVLIAGTAMLAVAFAGQAVQQAAFTTLDVSTPGSVAVHGPLIGHLFLFALISGAGMAAASGVAGWRSGRQPRWLAGLGPLVLVVEIVIIGVPDASAAAFPVFLVWLVAMSIWMMRIPTTGETSHS